MNARYMCCWLLIHYELYANFLCVVRTVFAFWLFKWRSFVNIMQLIYALLLGLIQKGFNWGDCLTEHVDLDKQGILFRHSWAICAGLAIVPWWCPDLSTSSYCPSGSPQYWTQQFPSLIYVWHEVIQYYIAEWAFKLLLGTYLSVSQVNHLRKPSLDAAFVLVYLQLRGTCLQ